MSQDYQHAHERRPAQHQPGLQPGRERAMEPEPVFIREDYRAGGRLDGKAALITGGDSGIGRSAAVHYAREGIQALIDGSLALAECMSGSRSVD